MDEIVRGVQSYLKKIALDRLGSLPMWMGVARRRPVAYPDRRAQTTHMTDEAKKDESQELESAEAEVIEFYIPLNFRKPIRWIPPAHRGKLLPFQRTQKKTA